MRVLSRVKKYFLELFLYFVPTPQISKYTYVSIVSIGRTGTHFLANFFAANYGNYVLARHEPIKRTKTLFSEYHLKMIDKQECEKLWLKDRLKYFKLLRLCNRTTWIESDGFNRTLIPIIRGVIQNYKFIYIIRDPRNWIRSFLSRKNFKYNFDENWQITPVLTGEISHEEWKQYSIIKKASWAWHYNNMLIYENLMCDKNSIFVRFEDIFNEGEGSLSMMIDFLDLKRNAHQSNLYPRKKSNESKKFLIPEFKDWSESDKLDMLKICKPLMQKFNYL